MMSATIVQLVQGSLAWQVHRQKYRNASETAAVMGGLAVADAVCAVGHSHWACAAGSDGSHGTGNGAGAAGAVGV